MDTSAKKILETVAVKTLHAHGFSRSSTQANLVLTDLLSRYLAHFASTVAKYAEHAGRRTISPRDALNAMHDLGTNMDELKDYCMTETRDMARYATHSTKRVEDLNDFAALLAIGLAHDDDDIIPLEWGPVSDTIAWEEDDDSEYDEVQTPHDDIVKPDVVMVEGDDVDAEGEDVSMDEHAEITLKEPHPILRPPRSPPLPLSPVSNPSTPPRKRPRTASWQPPQHIPDFLPPFPTDDAPRATSPHSGAPLSEPAAMTNSAVKLERPATPPLQAQVSTASSSADYLTVVPYEQSSLAAAPVWHLPQPTPFDDTSNLFRSQMPLPQMQPALLGAYHHILTNPPPPHVVSVNPARYRVALALVQQTEKYNRWDVSTTLYGSTTPNSPRVAPMPPSYAVPIAKPPGVGSGTGTPDGGAKGEKGEKEEEKRPLPSGPPRTIAPPERIVPLLSRQGSRISKLARNVLSGTVYTRTVRINHPPVLQRGAQKLTYGPGVNAPWNSSLSPMPVATPVPGKGKDAAAVNGAPNGKEKGIEAPRPLPDARLYATWSYEQKRFDEPLAVRRRVGSMASVPMGRARSESTNA